MAAVIFDLDGTLVDSAADIHAAVTVLLAEQGFPALRTDAVRNMVGNGAPVLIERVIAAVGAAPSSQTEWLARFLHIYESATALTKPYPGVDQAMQSLAAAGFRLGLCTNKPTAPTLALLRALGWQDHFAGVICGDSLTSRKPDPAMLHAATHLTGQPAIYVGDSEVDEATALAAGLPFLLFSQGYRKKPADAFAAAAVFDHFDDLPALVRRFAG